MNRPPIEAGLVSVIIPVFNRPELLREAVASVLAQEYTQLEIIVVDDGSTDETPGVIEKLRRDQSQRIRVIRIKNAGPGVAREAGRQLANGEFLQYLDSDDLLMPCKLRLQVAALQKHNECAVAYGMTEYRVIGEQACVKPHKRTGDDLRTIFPAMLSERWWSTNTPLYRRSACDAIGPWLPLRIEEDWEYDCRIAKFCNEVVAVPEYVSVSRSHNFEHACANGSSDPGKLRDRCLARLSILRTALESGFSAQDEHFNRFISESFLVVRQADLAGASESIALLKALLRSAPRAKMRAYSAMRQLLGARVASVWSEKAYALVNGGNLFD